MVRMNFTEAVYMATLNEAQGDTIRKLRRWLEVSSEAIWRAYKEVGSWSTDKLAKALWELAEVLRADAESTPHFRKDSRGRKVPTDRFSTGVMVWVLATMSLWARSPMSQAMVSTVATAVLTVMWSAGWLLAFPLGVTHTLLTIAEWNLKEGAWDDFEKEARGTPGEPEPREAPGVTGPYPSMDDYRPGRQFATKRAQDLLMGPGRPDLRPEPA